MKSIILYGSRYGSSEAYARELARRMEIEAEDISVFKDYSSYDRILYIGGLYVGKIYGLKKLLKRIGEQEIYLVTVGMGDPADQNTREMRGKQLEKQLKDRKLKEGHIFHLKGAMDYSTMSFIHRFLMKGLCSSLKKKPKKERNLMEQSIIDSYNNRLDLMDFNDLEHIKEALIGQGF